MRSSETPQLHPEEQPPLPGIDVEVPNADPRAASAPSRSQAFLHRLGLSSEARSERSERKQILATYLSGLVHNRIDEPAEGEEQTPPDITQPANLSRREARKALQVERALLNHDILQVNEDWVHKVAGDAGHYDPAATRKRRREDKKSIAERLQSGEIDSAEAHRLRTTSLNTFEYKPHAQHKAHVKREIAANEAMALAESVAPLDKRLRIDRRPHGPTLSPADHGVTESITEPTWHQNELISVNDDWSLRANVDPEKRDPLFDNAVSLVAEVQSASAGILAHHLDIPLKRAASILKDLQEANVVEGDTGYALKVLIPRPEQRSRQKGSGMSEHEKHMYLAVDKKVGSTIYERAQEEARGLGATKISDDRFKELEEEVRVELYNEHFGGNLSDEEIAAIKRNIHFLNTKKTGSRKKT